MFNSVSQVARSIGGNGKRSIRLMAISLLASISVAACGGGDEGAASPTNDSVNVTNQYKEGFMPAGFSTVNDFGVLQVDQDYFNFLLVNRGQTVVGSSGAVVSTSNSVAPLLCIRPTGSKVVVYSMNYVKGGTTQWTLRSEGTATVDWFVFDAGQPTQDVGPGISVYDASGRLAYNSNASEMRVKGVVTTPADPEAAYPRGDVVQGVPANVGACIAAPKARLQYSGVPVPLPTLVEGVQFEGGNIRVGYVNTGPGPIIDYTYILNDGQTQILLVDIAGL